MSIDTFFGNNHFPKNRKMIENVLIEWIESTQKRATDGILNNGILLLKRNYPTSSEI